jgi:hypothetical protein
MSDNLFSNYGKGFDNMFSSGLQAVNKKGENMYVGGDNENILKIYLMVIIAGYFIVKIIYPLFYKMFPKIEFNKEIYNLSATVVLSVVAFILTNFWKVNVHWVFYLGMILGVNYPALYNRLLLPIESGTLSEQETQKLFGTMLYVKVIVILLFILYAAIVSSQREVYLLYLGGIVLLMMGAMYVSYGKYKIELGLSFISWVLSLFYLFTPQTTTISIFSQLFFGMTIGTFVGNMSYLGPDYIFKADVNKQTDDNKQTDVKNVNGNNNVIDNLSFVTKINGIRWALIILIFFNLLLFVLYFMK